MINRNSIIYIIDISLNGIMKEKINNDLYLLKDFTLTVNTVNDALVLLQPLEGLEKVEDSGAAAVVQSTIFENVDHSIIISL